MRRRKGLARIDYDAPCRCCETEGIHITPNSSRGFRVCTPCAGVGYALYWPEQTTREESMRPLIRDEIRRGYYDAISNIPPKTDYRFPAYTLGHWWGRWSVRIGFFG